VLVHPCSSKADAMRARHFQTDKSQRFNNDEKRLAPRGQPRHRAHAKRQTLFGAFFLRRIPPQERASHNPRHARRRDRQRISQPLTASSFSSARSGMSRRKRPRPSLDERRIREKLDQLEASSRACLNFAKPRLAPFTAVGSRHRHRYAHARPASKVAQGKIISADPPPRTDHRAMCKRASFSSVPQHRAQLNPGMPDGGTHHRALRRTKGTMCSSEVQTTAPESPSRFKTRVSVVSFRQPRRQTGIGLAIAKRTSCSAMDGDIAIASHSPAGTTMRLNLPIAKN